jgi:Ca-activated chloride channel family protein
MSQGSINKNQINSKELIKAMRSKSDDSNPSKEFENSLLNSLLKKTGSSFSWSLNNITASFKNKLRNIRFLLFMTILSASTILAVIPKFIRQLGKEDDWVYSPSTLDYDGIITTYSPTTLGEFLIVGLILTILITNLVLSAKYIIKLFKKYIWSNKPKEVKMYKSRYMAVISFFSMIVTFPLSLYLLGKARERILTISTLGLIISSTISIVYSGYTVISAAIKKLRQKPNPLFKRRIKLSLLGGVQSGSFLLVSLLALMLVVRYPFLQMQGIDYSTTGGTGTPSWSPSVGTNAIPSPGIQNFGNTKSVDETIGYSTGGAKDINNFRDNIDNDYLPISSDITYEGLFYDYYFDTGEKAPCSQLFCPSYSKALSIDPISNEQEYYLSVGLNSGIKESDFERKNLNLVVVLDISGSMSSNFNQYYYDSKDPLEEFTSKSKMQIANESVSSLLKHLKPNDRFGMVLFESDAHLAKPLNKANETDLKSIQNHIMDIKPTGGTNMSAGLNMATEMLQEYSDVNSDLYENRIIFLTDAMPNTGVISEDSILSIAEENAANNIYSTYIGVGVDFNTELIEDITKVRGANYYSVHSSKDFKYRMDEGFEYMVTPLVFDLQLDIQANSYRIKEIYGSPEADKATGEIMYVNTLFPSDKTDEGTKGGLVLLELEKINESELDVSDIDLKVSYQDRKGEKYTNEVKISGFKETDGEYYENNGIRKGILLSRYATLLKSWIIDTREELDETSYEAQVNIEDGIPSSSSSNQLGQWERQSENLYVSTYYNQIFDDFTGYFEEEVNELGDDDLNKEVAVLEKLSEF